MTWLHQWRSSTKFLIAVIALGMMAPLVARCRLAPDVAAARISEFSIAYMGFRILEPLVEQNHTPLADEHEPSFGRC